MNAPTAVVPTKNRLSKSFIGSIEVKGGRNEAGSSAFCYALQKNYF